MKKLYTYIKTGYSSGVYGRSDEYFTWIVIRGNNIGTFRTKGLYGTGYQYAEADLKAMGFECFPTSAIYGKVVRSDYKGFRWDNEEDITYFAKFGKYKE